MDEGTSALDPATERRVNSALKALRMTRIIAAHRPETLAAADRVVAIEN
jgi:ATP-binding cassette subfamily B protein RaxB